MSVVVLGRSVNFITVFLLRSSGMPLTLKDDPYAVRANHLRANFALHSGNGDGIHLTCLFATRDTKTSRFPLLRSGTLSPFVRCRTERVNTISISQPKLKKIATECTGIWWIELQLEQTVPPSFHHTNHELKYCQSLPCCRQWHCANVLAHVSKKVHPKVSNQYGKSLVLQLPNP